MNLIKASAEIIPQGSGLEGIYKHIELAGRTCYKSLDKITEDSAKDFVDRMIKSGHGAMLEHGTVYLTIPGEHEPDEWGRADVFVNYKGSYRYNKYSKVVVEYWEQEPVGTQCEFCKKISRSRLHITTNLRVLVENNWLDDLKYLCEPTEYHERRITVKFVTDQGILREFTRHRVFSFAVESTRYCNYSKNKFDNEITYILPPWIDENLVNPQFKCHTSDDWGDLVYEYYYNLTESGDEYLQCSNGLDVRNFLFSLGVSEQIYLSLIKQGWTAQQARNVLPLATKCDIIMTGFVSDWKHFFELRALGTTGAPHPQAKEIAEPLMQEFIKQNLI
jgi:thymidylate synthase (FAD)